MVRVCVVYGCNSSDYQLGLWRKKLCLTHNCLFDVGCCICPPPFQLFMFPKSEVDRKLWIKMINRKSENGDNWQPTKNGRVCSKHFIDGSPTEAHPYPELSLGYEYNPKKRRPAPKQRLPAPNTTVKRKCLEATVSGEPCVDSGTIAATSIDNCYSDLNVVCADTAAVTKDVPIVCPVIDHDYVNVTMLSTKCLDNHSCNGCDEKDKIIAELQKTVADLTKKLERSTTPVQCVPAKPAPSSKLYISLNRARSDKTVLSDKFTRSDALVKLNTGLASKNLLNALCRFLKAKAQKLRYWSGTKRSTVQTYRHRYLRRTPIKPGASRSLTVRDELVMVLMKLRLGLHSSFLACLFNVSEASCSSIFNTWVKFLAQQLKCLVFWPSKEATRAMMPKSLAMKYPNLRCTLDCSETFVQRPRDLYLQATTWSDYKHHNTLKYLVAIAPNGHISFVSSAWGGRTTDRHIVQQSGILDLIDAGDNILADRGFTIQEDLLYRQATLIIPPSSSGKCQMTRDNVLKTRKIANARIHVERAINRLKWFKILNTTVPITLVPLFDDILLICSSLCNLLPPLVQ